MQHIFLIGAMKSGTSSLYDALCMHPEICPCKVKEPEYFSEKMGGKEYKSGAYMDLFQIDSNTHRFTLDASTGYSKFPEETGIPEKIKSFTPEPYLIYVVRNPFDRIVSHYNFMKGKDLKWNYKIDDPYLVQISNYHLQLKQYENVFGRNRIMVIDFDDLISHPEQICYSIYSFIGASSFNQPSKFEAKNVANPSSKSQLKLVHKAKNFKKFIPHGLKPRLKKILNIIFTPPEKVTLTAKQRWEISMSLETDMQQLRKRYGIDIKKWGF